MTRGRGVRAVSRAGAVVVSLAAGVALAACVGGGEPAGATSPSAEAAAPSDTAVASPVAPSDDPTTSAPEETPSPSDAAAGPSPFPTPSAWGGSVEIDTGHVPGWFEGSGWSCGMPAGLLDQSLDPATTLTAAGPLTAGDEAADGAALLPVEIATTGRKASHMSPVVAVVVRDGVVVSLPPLADAEPVEATPKADAAVAARNYCLPGGEAQGMTAYDQKLPDGAYEVRAFVELDPGADPRRFALTAPIPAELKNGTWTPTAR